MGPLSHTHTDTKTQRHNTLVQRQGKRPKTPKSVGNLDQYTISFWRIFCLTHGHRTRTNRMVLFFFSAVFSFVLFVYAATAFMSSPEYWLLLRRRRLTAQRAWCAVQCAIMLLRCWFDFSNRIVESILFIYRISCWRHLKSTHDGMCSAVTSRQPVEQRLVRVGECGKTKCGIYL